MTFKAKVPLTDQQSPALMPVYHYVTIQLAYHLSSIWMDASCHPHPSRRSRIMAPALRHTRPRRHCPLAKHPSYSTRPTGLLDLLRRDEGNIVLQHRQYVCGPMCRSTSMSPNCDDATPEVPGRPTSISSPRTAVCPGDHQGWGDKLLTLPTRLRCRAAHQ